MRTGHEVGGLDTGFYRDGCLYLDPLGMPFGPRTVYKDLRTVTAADFEGFDAVIHLAELSNDPLGQNRPEITFRSTTRARCALRRRRARPGVRRFVYASSCSVYGVGTGEFLDETAAHQSADRLCAMQGARRARPAADGRRAASA